MIDEVFCIAGLLKGREALDRTASLLPPDRRENVLRLADEFSKLSAQALQEKLTGLRASTANESGSRFTAEVGTGWRELPPILQNWLAQATWTAHGNEDH